MRANRAAGHLPGAVHALPATMPALAEHLDRDAPVGVHCATGHRSALAVSLSSAPVSPTSGMSPTASTHRESLGHPRVAAAWGWKRGPVSFRAVRV
jgi:hypothetical protein